MKSVFEILQEAPLLQRPPVSVELCKVGWNEMKAFDVKVGVGGAPTMADHILAGLLWRYPATRAELLTPASQDRFMAIVQEAKIRLTAVASVNPKVKALYENIQGNSSPF